jgi:hypothetical protein
MYVFLCFVYVEKQCTSQGSRLWLPDRSSRICWCATSAIHIGTYSSGEICDQIHMDVSDYCHLICAILIVQSFIICQLCLTHQSVCKILHCKICRCPLVKSYLYYMFSVCLGFKTRLWLSAHLGWVKLTTETICVNCGELERTDKNGQRVNI